MSKHKPTLSEALQTSLSSVQEAWRDWESIAASPQNENKKTSKPEQVAVDTEPLFKRLKNQLDSLS